MSVTWDTTNNNGQSVAPGTYYVEVKSTDAFGKVTVYSEAVTVMGTLVSNSLKVYNSAGEMVDQVNLTALTGLATGFSSATGSSAAVAGSGLKFNVQVVGSNTPEQVAWNGLNAQGQPVSPGVYMVELVYAPVGQASAVVKVMPVTILDRPGGAAQTALAGAVVAPQPYVAAKGGGLNVVYTPVPGEQLSGRLYNLAGQLVEQGLDAQGSGRITLSVDRVSSGIYLMELQMDDGDAILARRIVKVAIVN
jgi:hypothetical protein